MSSTPYSFVTSGGVSNTRVRLSNHEATLADLRHRFGTPVSVETEAASYHNSTPKQRSAVKKELNYFVGGTIEGKRHDENVLARTLLTLDVEGKDGESTQPPAPEAVFSRLKAMGGEGWIYTSLSHTEEKPRYRVVLPLGKPIKGTEQEMAAALKASTKHAAGRLDIEPWARPESWVLSQPMYLPAVLKGGRFFEDYNPGKAWSPRVNTVEESGPKNFDSVAIDEPVLAEIKTAGLYLGPKLGQDGAHFIRCPHHDRHEAENDTQTVYFEPHHGGFEHGNPKCFDTGPDDGGRPHLTRESLTQWLRNEGHLHGKHDTALEDVDAFLGRTTIGDMLTTEPKALEFAIEGFAPLGMVTVLGGPGGVSKSALALRLLLAAASGSHFGPYKVKQAIKCLYVTYEDDRKTFHFRFRAMYEDFAAEMQGAQDLLYADPVKNLHIAAVADEGPAWWLMRKEKFETPTPTARVDFLRNVLTRSKAKLLVLDPFAHTHSLNENDNADIATFMHMLSRLARETECAILLLHHIGKQAESEGLAGTSQGSLRGASALAAHARSVSTMYSVNAKDAPDYGLPATDETARNYAVVKHVKHNHSAGMVPAVFKRDGALLRHQPSIGRLSPERAKEFRENAKLENDQLKVRVDALLVAQFLAEVALNDDAQGPAFAGTNLVKATVFKNGSLRTKRAIEKAEELGWIHNQSTNQRNEWIVTTEGKAAAANQP